MKGHLARFVINFTFLPPAKCRQMSTLTPGIMDTIFHDWKFFSFWKEISNDIYICFAYFIVRLAILE